MGNDKVNRAAALAAIVLCGMLSACGGRPMPFPIPESELGDQPGLFTGEKGAWDVLPHDPPQPPPPR